MAKKSESDPAELTSTLKLLALTAVRRLPQKEQIRLMRLAGFDRHRIAEFVGTTALTVSVTLSNLKKSTKNKKKLGRRKQ